jgi:hypothetical protein
MAYKNMKSVLVLFILHIVFTSGSLFAGGEQNTRRMTITITNNTGGTIEKIFFTPSEKKPYTEGIIEGFIEKFLGEKPYSETCNIIKGDSYTTTLDKSGYYDIVLVDTNGHYYGKTGCRWISGSETLVITDKDFISQGFWDTFKKVVGL